MNFFSENFWFVIILAITFLSLISIYYWLTDKKERIKSIVVYFGTFISIAIFFKIYEDMFVLKFLNLSIIVLIEIEFILILIIFYINLFILQKNFRSNLILYLHSIMILLASHIFIAGLPGMFITGTITIIIIGIVISIIVIPFDEEYKLLAFFIGLSLFFYISIVLEVLY